MPTRPSLGCSLDARDADPAKLFPSDSGIAYHLVRVLLSHLPTLQSETLGKVKTETQSEYPMIRPDVDPSAPEDEQPVIGLIGMGEMGKMYARLLSGAGWKK